MTSSLQQNQKLGRGLSALLGDSNRNKGIDYESSLNRKKNNGDVIESIPLNKITAGIYQPRRKFDHEEIKELAESIKANGLIQPIILRKNDDDGHYEIIAGERRFRATKSLGLTSISAIIKKINNHEALEIALVENVQRSDLSLIEEAEGYKQLMNEFSYTQDQIAKKTGKSRSHIANILRLIELPKSVKDLLNEKKLTMGHARAILKSKNPELLAQKIVEDSLSVRDVEDEIRNEKVADIKSNPVITREESQIKFINSGQLTDIENRMSQLLDSKVKISFNQFKNRGKITINFDDLEKIYALLDKLEE